MINNSISARNLGNPIQLKIRCIIQNDDALSQEDIQMTMKIVITIIQTKKRKFQELDSRSFFTNRSNYSEQSSQYHSFYESQSSFSAEFYGFQSSSSAEFYGFQSSSSVESFHSSYELASQSFSSTFHFSSIFHFRISPSDVMKNLQSRNSQIFESNSGPRRIRLFIKNVLPSKKSTDGRLVLLENKLRDMKKKKKKHKHTRKF